MAFQRIELEVLVASMINLCALVARRHVVLVAADMEVADEVHQDFLPKFNGSL